MRKVLSVCFMIVVFLAVGCGGGGGDGGSAGPTVTPTTQSLIGTYTLTAFRVEYSNGAIITEKNFTSYSGLMTVGPVLFSQTVTIKDTTVNNTGNYSVTYTKGTSEGIIHVANAADTADVSFAASGNTLVIYTGVATYQNGLTSQEWQWWEKTSDVVKIVSGHVEEKNTPSKIKFMGNTILENDLVVME